MGIYLDYNASAPIDLRVLEMMTKIYRNNVGNADSRTHLFGDASRSLIENARRDVAELMGVKSDEVIFTSGATESDNIAILGLKNYALTSGKKHIITTSIEHKAVLEAVNNLMKDGFEVDFVDPAMSGRISVEDISKKLRSDTLLVSVMHVNNETGIIQPVKELGVLLSKKGVLFHVDATQSCGKLVEEIRQLRFDMMSVSAHKMHGPQGIGALILRKKNYKFPPVSALMFGGNQEHGLRPGTLPVALIGGFGRACSLAEDEYEEHHRRNIEIKKTLMSLINSSGLSYHINGDSKYCVPTTLNISFTGVSSEALMLATKQYCGISNGSACTSRSYNHSHVLSAMKLPTERLDTALRLSWDYDVDITDLKKEFRFLLNVVYQFQID